MELSNAIDMLRVSHALTTVRKGIRSVSTEDWKHQYQERFKLALQGMATDDAARGRFGTVIERLLETTEKDPWTAVTEAGQAIEAFIAAHRN